MRLIAEFFKIYAQNFLFAFIVVLGSVVFLSISTYFYFAKDLKNKEVIMNRNNAGITLFDIKDRPFFSFYKAKREVFVPINEIPLSVQNAIIASEDKDYYKHPGFSVKSIIRSIILNIKEKEVVYGGSTITQQLIKNSLLTSDKTFLRKYREIVLAEEIERRFTKSEILEMYLNSVYFGEGAYGIEEASQTYFNKRARQLNLSESAMLIGLLPSPSNLSPISGNKSLTKVRQEFVLNTMYKEEYISFNEWIMAKKEKLNFNYTIDINNKAPHFALFVRDKLIEKYGENELSKSGFKIKTTIDLDWQYFAENTVRDQVEKLKRNNVSNGAVVVIDARTGEIKAMVGSKDWYDSSFGKVNMTTVPRQVGSSFKPIIYARAFEKGIITASTVLNDKPAVFAGGYKPQNYDKRFRGEVLVRRSLANSLNVPSVQVMSKLGVESGLKIAQRLGITTLNDQSKYGLSLVLGAGEVPLLELTNAYTVFASGGLKNDPTAILEIRDKYDNLIYKYTPKRERVLNAGSAFLISSILSDRQARREVFGNVLDISKIAAVKTGTTENYKDSLTLGYTPDLSIGAWVGNNDNTPMDNIAGSLGAAPIWKQLMEKFLEGKPNQEFTVPQGIVKATVCISTSSAMLEYFTEETKPKDCSL